jgi:hypothetical protein
MFEIENLDGSWTKLNATSQKMAANQFEVTIFWHEQMAGKPDMLDAVTCRLNGVVCRQVLGKSKSPKMPGGTTLIVQVLL